MQGREAAQIPAGFLQPWMVRRAALCMPKSAQSPPSALAALAACGCQAEHREQRRNVPFPKAARGSNLK